MRRIEIAYLLAAFSMVGVSGLQRFYLGKYWTGALWFATGGLFFLGTLYDLFTLPEQIDEFNRKLLGAGPQPQALPPSSVREHSVGESTAAPEAMDLELRILKLAQEHNGRLTVVLTATELGVQLAEAEAKLDDLARSQHANIEIEDHGVVVYDFPAFRVS